MEDLIDDSMDMEEGEAPSFAPEQPPMIKISNILVGNNPTTFVNLLPFRVEFNCRINFNAKVTFTVTYCVGEDQNDQVLAKQEVGPFKQGNNFFLMKANPPNPQKMKKEDVLGNGLILIEGKYKENRFLRVGYFVNNEYPKDQDQNNVNLKLVKRTILSAKPRVTTYSINWN